MQACKTVNEPKPKIKQTNNHNEMKQTQIKQWEKYFVHTINIAQSYFKHLSRELFFSPNYPFIFSLTKFSINYWGSQKEPYSEQLQANALLLSFAFCCDILDTAKPRDKWPRGTQNSQIHGLIVGPNDQRYEDCTRILLT